jgi:hypothetical protein
MKRHRGSTMAYRLISLGVASIEDWVLRPILQRHNDSTSRVLKFTPLHHNPTHRQNTKKKASANV